jgi:hypothetical protein
VRRGDGRTYTRATESIKPHPIRVCMENHCRDRDWRGGMTPPPSSTRVGRAVRGVRQPHAQLRHVRRAPLVPWAVKPLQLRCACCARAVRVLCACCARAVSVLRACYESVAWRQTTPTTRPQLNATARRRSGARRATARRCAWPRRRRAAPRRCGLGLAAGGTAVLTGSGGVIARLLRTALRNGSQWQSTTAKKGGAPKVLLRCDSLSAVGSRCICTHNCRCSCTHRQPVVPVQALRFNRSMYSRSSGSKSFRVGESAVRRAR